MGYRDHIVAKLSALAVAGGTTAMLFAASPVHTAFSATTSGSLSASGATVAQTLTNGNLVATGLLPGVATNPVVVSLHNSGNVTENFTLNVNGAGATTPNGGTPLPNWTALQQLEYGYNAYYVCSQPVANPANNVDSGTCKDYSPNTTTFVQLFPDATAVSVGTSYSHTISSVKPGRYLYLSIILKLHNVSGTTGTEMGGPNAWNGASVKIPYTITAEPSATQPSATQPTLTATGQSVGS